MKLPILLDSLIQALQCLPGIGSKTAQRLAFFMLARDPKAGRKLGLAIEQALAKIGRCHQCSNFAERHNDYYLCAICADLCRHKTGQICVVESPVDLLAIEQTGQFFGRYFVLMGRLSPVDGIGPEQLELDKLHQQLTSEVKELILAISPTVEGEATCYYISQLAASKQIPVARIAYGIPVGGELEFIDGTTLSISFAGRQPVVFN